MKNAIHKVLHPVLSALIKTQRKHQLHIMNEAPLIKENAIYAVNHSCKHDFPIAGEVIGRHTFVLVGKQNLKLVDRICFYINGVIYVDRKDGQSRRKTKKKLSDYILNGQNICMFPEGTWNLTPSKPMLPLYWGIIDIARTTGRPIVPIVLEYRDRDCYVKWGAPFYVLSKDSKQSKIDELSNQMATLKWEIWESFPVISRECVNRGDWSIEVKKRIAEYPRLNYEYEKSCIRTSTKNI